MTSSARATFTLLALLAVSAAQAQGPALDRVMHKKLEVSQQILEAVVTSRWDALEARSRELESLTNDPGWTVLKAPEARVTATPSRLQCARFMTPLPNGISTRLPRPTWR
jgi:hypothetical protein